MGNETMTDEEECKIDNNFSQDIRQAESENEVRAETPCFLAAKISKNEPMQKNEEAAKNSTVTPGFENLKIRDETSEKSKPKKQVPIFSVPKKRKTQFSVPFILQEIQSEHDECVEFLKLL